MKLVTLLSPAEIAQLPERPLDDAYCVVFDILRATSSIVTAFAHGAEGVLAVREIDEARAAARDAAASGESILLAGERGGDRIEGFDLGNSPAEFTRCHSRRIVTTTTNGTVALRACVRARRVVAGSLLNLASLAADVRSHSPARLVLVCAGTHDRVALEDVYAAGRLMQTLALDASGDDASELAYSVARRFGSDAHAALTHAENGRTLTAAGRTDDIAWAARESIYNTLPAMQPDGWLVA